MQVAEQVVTLDNGLGACVCIVVHVCSALFVGSSFLPTYSDVRSIGENLTLVVESVAFCVQQILLHLDLYFVNRVVQATTVLTWYFGWLMLDALVLDLSVCGRH